MDRTKAAKAAKAAKQRGYAVEGGCVEKTCPRCDEKGVLFLLRGDYTPRAVIVWGPEGGYWYDTGTWETLTGSDFGCGYCPSRPEH